MAAENRRIGDSRTARSSRTTDFSSSSSQTLLQFNSLAVESGPIRVPFFIVPFV